MDTTAYENTLAKVKRYQYIEDRIKELTNLQAAIRKDLAYSTGCCGAYRSYTANNTYTLSRNMMQELSAMAEGELAKLEVERENL